MSPRLLTLWCWLGPCALAAAWPVDKVVQLQGGREQFERLAALDWVEVEKPAVAEAEVLPSGELLLTGKQAGGETLLLLFAEGRMAVWRLQVEPVMADGGVEAAEAAAKAACPGMKLDPGAAEEALVVRVKGEGCRAALKALFQRDRYLGRQLSLAFEVPELQAQLRALQQGVDSVTSPGAVKAVYLGAGLRLTGQVTAAQKRAVLWQAFRHSVGRVALEDRMTER
ncbi:MAG: pilus assembly protein N-terminal domain-containing protein [Deltaproteobacteria bacterium]|nr:pilus assembly protein N-terminal domain-containing protein [Deltaproteobacteria bacterium]